MVVRCAHSHTLLARENNQKKCLHTIRDNIMDGLYEKQKINAVNRVIRFIWTNHMHDASTGASNMSSRMAATKQIIFGQYATRQNMMISAVQSEGISDPVRGRQRLGKYPQICNCLLHLTCRLVSGDSTLSLSLSFVPPRR